MKNRFSYYGLVRYSFPVLILVFQLVSNQCWSQDIDRIEYFFDSDPGYGAGTSVPLIPAPQLSGFTYSVDLAILATGFHTLYMRVRDTIGRWSNCEYKQIYKGSPVNPPISRGNIIRAEYFFDSDPGLGSGVPIPVTPEINISNFNYAIDLSAVPTGFHCVYVRVRNASGSWSTCEYKCFYKGLPVLPPDPAKNMVAAEYFFDTDPGFGNGISITVNPSTILGNVPVVVDLGAVPEGFHAFYFRIRTNSGKWSTCEYKTFYKGTVDLPSSMQPIVKLEYYIDVDPGYGSANEVPLIPGTQMISQVFLADLSLVPQGTHYLSARVKDAAGRWSTVAWASFVQDFSVVNVTIVASANPVCSGHQVTFTAYPVNGGETPSYQWMVNGQYAGWNSPVFSYLPSDDDDVLCILTSNLSNVINNPATSNHIIMEVVQAPEPAIDGMLSVCLEDPVVTYTTEPGMTDYTWNIYYGGTIISGGGATDHTMTVRWNPAGTKAVSVNYVNQAGCSSFFPGYFYTVVNPQPLPVVTGPSELCAGDPGAVYHTDSGMTEYLWTVSAGGEITGGEGSNSITVNWNTVGEQWVEVSYEGTYCSSTLTHYDVTVSPGTVAGTVAGENSILFGMETTLALQGSVGSVLRWQKRFNGGPWQDVAATTTAYSEIPDTTGTWEYRAEVQSGICSAFFSGMATVVVEPVIRTINLKVFLEGLYNPATSQMNKAQDEYGDKFPGTIADKIQVRAAKPYSPYAVCYVADDVDLNQDGTCTVTIPRSGYYFLFIRHRNSIETWSTAPVNAMPEPVEYDFSLGASQALGDNQREISGTYAVWGGDVNQDGIVDASDMNPVDNASTAITFGYIPEDVNGDGIVDGGDMNIVDNNSTAIIFAITP